jgi:hypothetical protein
MQNLKAVAMGVVAAITNAAMLVAARTLSKLSFLPSPDLQTNSFSHCCARTRKSRPIKKHQKSPRGRRHFWKQ